MEKKKIIKRLLQFQKVRQMANIHIEKQQKICYN